MYVKTYPLSLIGLERQHCVVVGGGTVAARKVSGLLDAGAKKITVISPECNPDLRSWSESGALVWVRRPYVPGDLDGAFLVIAAADDPQVNREVWEEARNAACLVNVVDDPEHSNVIMPAVVRRGDLNIAISTGGASPTLARRLRERLETLIGPEYAGLAELLADLRPVLLENFPPGEPRRQAALRLVDLGLEAVLRDQGAEAARRQALDLLEALARDGDVISR